MEKELCDVLVEQVTLGNNPNSIVESTWTHVKDKCNEKMRKNLMMEQIKNRYNLLRTRYQDFKKFLEISGFGWDPREKKVRVDDEGLWDSYLKEYPEHKRYKTSGCLIYDELCVIFGGTKASGNLGCVSAEDKVTGDVSTHYDELNVEGCHIETPIPNSREVSSALIGENEVSENSMRKNGEQVNQESASEQQLSKEFKNPELSDATASGNLGYVSAKDKVTEDVSTEPNVERANDEAPITNLREGSSVLIEENKVSQNSMRKNSEQENQESASEQQLSKKEFKNSELSDGTGSGSLGYVSAKDKVTEDVSTHYHEPNVERGNVEAPITNLRERSSALIGEGSSALIGENEVSEYSTRNTSEQGKRKSSSEKQQSNKEFKNSELRDATASGNLGYVSAKDKVTEDVSTHYHEPGVVERGNVEMPIPNLREGSSALIGENECSENSMRKRKRKSSSEQQQSKKEFKNSVLSDALFAIVDATKSKYVAKDPETDPYSIPNCVKHLRSIEGVSIQSVMVALEKFQQEGWRQAFTSLDLVLQKEWLKSIAP